MFHELWLRWKALRLPWRKRFLAGTDLQGNTFWEFRSQLTQGRFRRIVKYPSKTHHSDVSIPPQWLQWLRHTRKHPPSVEEQRMDVLRQERMRVLAAQSDARWAEKPSYLDAPVREGAGLKDSDGGQLAGVSDLDKASKIYNVDGGNVKNDSSKVVVTQEDILGHARKSTTKTNAKSDPWATSSKSRDEPQPWNPKIVKRR